MTVNITGIPEFQLTPRGNLTTGATALEREFGELTSLEQDLLCLASTIHAADLAGLRGERERCDRRIRLCIPVVNYPAFQLVRDRLQLVLYELTNDAWEINFERRQGTPEGNHPWQQVDGATLLFSGGLDSLAAAIVLANEGANLQLVSHTSGNQVTAAAQNQLAAYVERVSSAPMSHVAIRVGAQNRGDYEFPGDKESSQRARSFLFLTLGAVSARRSGHRRLIYIAENGQMAIHVPLTAARIGSFSTHTAHPQIISEIESILQDLLGVPIAVENPFLYMTKAEVVGLVKGHPEAIGQSVSCWRSRVPGDKNHCGECVPCLIRRIALETNGISLDEYAVDAFSQDPTLLPDSSKGKINLLELAEFVHRFGGSATDSELAFDFPDLINESFDQGRATAMYRRAANEAQRVLARYPNMRAVLSL